MLVRYKQTGQLGNIPDDKFDPQLFEKASNGSNQAQSINQSTGNFVLDILKGMAQPFIKTGQNIGGAAFASGQVGLANLLSKSNPQQAAQLASVQNPFKSQQELQQIGNDPLRAIYEQGIKPSAGVASYAIPFGKGANILTKALLPGAGLGAAQAFSSTPQEAGPGETAARTIGGATIGATAGGATYVAGKVLQWGLNKIGSGLVKTGDALVSSQYNVPRTAGQALKTKETISALSKYGIRNIDEVIPASQKITGESGVLSKITRESVARAKSIDTTGLLDLGQQISNDPALPVGQDQKFFNYIKKSIVNLFPTGGKSASEALQGDSLKTFELIQELEKKAAKLTTGKVGFQIAPENQALAGAYRLFADELKDRLFIGAGADKAVVNVANNPRFLQLANEVSPKFAEALTKAKTVADIRALAAPFVRASQLAQLTEAGGQMAGQTLGGAVKGVGRMVQNPLNLLAIPLSSNAVSSGLGGLLSGTGGRFAGANLTGAMGSKLASILATQSSNLPQRQPSNGQTLPTQTASTTQEPILSPKGQWRWDPQKNDWVPNEQASAGGVSKERIQQAMIQDLATSGGKNIPELKTIYDVMFPTSTQSQMQKTLVPAVEATKELTTMDYSGTGPQNRVSKFQIDVLGGFGVDQNTVSLNQKFELLKQVVVRSLQGARMSDKDIERATQYIPNILDTPATIKTKLTNLDKFLEALSSQ